MYSISKGTVGKQENGVTLVFWPTNKIKVCDKRIVTTNLCTTTVVAEQRIATCQNGDTGNMTRMQLAEKMTVIRNDWEQYENTLRLEPESP